jgi:hypothetical protein
LTPIGMERVRNTKTAISNFFSTNTFGLMTVEKTKDVMQSEEAKKHDRHVAVYMRKCNDTL